MAEGIKELTDSNFAEEIKNGVTLVDFWAPWCGPCQMQTPILEQLVPQVGDTTTIAKMNVDEGQQVAGQLGIRAIPTLFVFKDGSVVQQFVGVQQESVLLSAIEDAQA